MAEKLNLGKNERVGNLSREAEQGRERIAEQLERKSPERSRDKQEKVESAKHEALKRAVSKEKQPAKERGPEKETNRPPVNSKRARKESYQRIMKETRSQMSPASRSFSKVIHNPAVEKASEAVGKTVARPNAILAGSVSACLIVLATYLIANNYGYPLSGAETMIAFAAGWLLGILYDFFRQMITGGR